MSNDITWAYEPAYELWPYIEPDSDSSDNFPSDEVSKDQENTYDQEHEDVLLVLRKKQIRLKRGGQTALIQIKSDI